MGQKKSKPKSTCQKIGTVIGSVVASAVVGLCVGALGVATGGIGWVAAGCIAAGSAACAGTQSAIDKGETFVIGVDINLNWLKRAKGERTDDTVRAGYHSQGNIINSANHEPTITTSIAHGAVNGLKLKYPNGLSMQYGSFDNNCLESDALKQALTDVIASAQYYERPGSWLSMKGLGFHVGIAVQCRSGQQYLLHHMPGESIPRVSEFNDKIKKEQGWKLKHHIKVAEGFQWYVGNLR
eukprot:515245_1